MTVADTRVHGTTHEVPRERFVRAEQPQLTPLGSRSLYHHERVLHHVVAADALVAIDGSCYSVPAQYVGETVTVQALLGAPGRVRDPSQRARDRAAPEAGAAPRGHGPRRTTRGCCGRRRSGPHPRPHALSPATLRPRARRIRRRPWSRCATWPSTPRSGRALVVGAGWGRRRRHDDAITGTPRGALSAPAPASRRAGARRAA